MMFLVSQDEFRSQNQVLVETYQRMILEDLKVQNILENFRRFCLNSDCEKELAQDKPETEICVQAQGSLHDSTSLVHTSRENAEKDLIDFGPEKEETEKSLNEEKKELVRDKLDCDNRRELNAR